MLKKLQITFLAILSFCKVVCGGQIENISGNTGAEIELRRNFHINFREGDKESKLLYQRQLMEFATSPLQVPLKWYFSGVAPREYVVLLADNPQLTNAKKIVTDVNIVWVDNLLLGTTYYWQVSGMVDGKKIESEVFSFRTGDTPPRWIRIPGAGNFRDIGGWSVPGGKVRQAMVYRGTRIDRAPWLAAPEGLNILLNDLKIKSELDLRGPAKNPFILKGHGVNVIAEAYQGYMIGLQKPAIRKMTVELLKKFTDPEFYPVYVHCDGGADRTGTLIFLLEAILGMSDEDLLLDYEYTTFFGYRHRSTKQMKPFLDMIDSKPGKNMSEKAIAFLKEEGMTEEDMDKIRTLLINRQED